VFRFSKHDTLIRKSNIQPYFIYTINKQILSSIGYTLFLDKEKFRTEGELTYNYFPQYYYGIGDNLSHNDPELFTYHWVKIYNRTAYLLQRGLFVGMAYEYVNMFEVSSSPSGLLSTTKPLGYNGFLASGFGPTFTYDTRDNVLNATKGWYLDMTFILLNKAWGSTSNFEQLKFDLRKFHKVFPQLQHVLAFQCVGTFLPGNVPFKQMAELGGDGIMRGYYSGWYRDNYYFAVQAEYRIPIWKYFGAVAFVGEGSVADRFSQLVTNRIWPSYGVGLRVKVSKKDNINIRLDYGRGDGSDGFYISIAEAF